MWISHSIGCALLILFLCSAATQIYAQYPGQIVNPDKYALNLRAVGVLEWTGDAQHPKTSRLVPICVYDGKVLQDASVYMARPEPLAVESEVEYQLQQNGKPIGIFDIQSSALLQGSWFGYGKWRPLPHPKAAPAQIAKIDEDNDAQSDTPVLHRKHGSDDSDSSKSSGSGPASGSSAPSDPDRPTLHKGGDSSADKSDSTASANTGPAPDPDRPTLHKTAPPDTASAGGAGTSDATPKGDSDSYVSDVAKLTDPDRPHLSRGKAEGMSSPILPSLVGMPPDMQQAVAVSDVKTRPEHLWNFSWADPADEAKMKAAMEDLARKALGIDGPPAAPAKPAAKTSAAAKTSSARRPVRLTLPPQPDPLVDEQFRVFELAYGSGATMVLTAHTDGSDGKPIRYVTLICQPDLYGNLATLVKNVADASHLDDTPRMRLVDAIDAQADNRGELLFELRGATQRQFALYRVLRGDATRIFLSSGEATGAIIAGN